MKETASKSIPAPVNMSLAASPLIDKEKIRILQDRSLQLQKVRDFFREKKVLEVDCPNLLSFPNIDSHIEPIKVKDKYLHTSPEFMQKRLLSSGMGDIYSLGHVFRKEEEGPRHSCEFTLAEWYRINISFDLFIEEVIELFFLFFPKAPIEKISYQEAFKKATNLDPWSLSKQELLSYLQKRNYSLSDALKKMDIEDLLPLVFSEFVEPAFNPDNLTVIYDYPPSQAALAKIIDNKAKRFEIYYQGLELCNGYDELGVSSEQKKRFEKENLKRLQSQKEPLPIDENFVLSLDHLPQACGCAVGFDRLMMIRHQKKEIDQVII